MNINKAVFIGSFGEIDQLPGPELPEVGFAGRANVGKSSLINRLLGVRRLALTSSKPGKTRTINFYRVDDACLFVDLPGYGFSRVSKSEQARWRGLIEGYLRGRESLRMLIVLMDARHGALANDKQMLKWLAAESLPHMKVLTKADKLGRNRLAAQRRKLARSGHELSGAVLCSAVSGEGIKQIRSAIDKAIS